MRSKSLLIKMIILGNVMCMIPVLLVGTFSYVQSSRQVQKQARQAELQFLRQVNSNIEQVLITVNHTLTNLSESTVMQSALLSPLHAADFRLYNNLRSEIIHLQSFDTKVEDLVLINKRQDWLIKNSGIKRLSRHDDRDLYLSFFDSGPPSAWMLLENRRFRDSIVSSQSCPYTISLVQKLPHIRTEKFGLAFANIPACSIAAMIDPGREAEEVMIMDGNGQIVVHHEQSKIGTSLEHHPVFASGVRFPDPSGQFRLTHQNEPYIVTYHKSNFNDWTYISVISIDRLTAASRQIGWFTLLISLAIIALSFIMVWLASSRLYSPVQRLVQSIAVSGGGSDTGRAAGPRSEMQMIEDHIRQLFTSKSRLEHEIRDHRQQIRSLFLTRLFSGHLRASEIEEKMRDFGFDGLVGAWNRMTVLTLQVDTLGNTRYETGDLELLQYAVANIVEEKIPPDERLPIVWFDRTLVILVGLSETEPDLVHDRIYTLTEALQALIGRYLHLSVSIGISAPFEEINQAARAYSEGLEALRHRFRLGKGVIVPYRSLNAGNPPVLFAYPERAEHELIEAIRAADPEEAARWLRAWMDDAADKMPTPGELQVGMMQLLNRLLILKQETGIRSRQIGIRPSALYEELLGLQMSEEIESWFRTRLIEPLIQVFSDRRASEYHTLSERMIDLIHRHFDSDFTLEDCAAMLHYNANYLSGVFRSETGRTFSEYLAHYRMQMAKQWLTETDMTVKQIADRLRYRNSHNFIRSFRKLEGMTPGQYRDKYAPGAN